jgi:pyrroloquinoline quinone biosynthesis protein D
VSPASSVTPQRPIANEFSRPGFPAHVRMRFDPVRQRLAVLAPERVYWPDEIAAAILELCDGERTVGTIAAQLAPGFAAPAETIQNDVLEFVQSWLDIRLLRL